MFRHVKFRLTLLIIPKSNFLRFSHYGSKFDSISSSKVNHLSTIFLICTQIKMYVRRNQQSSANKATFGQILVYLLIYLNKKQVFLPIIFSLVNSKKLYSDLSTIFLDFFLICTFSPYMETVSIFKGEYKSRKIVDKSEYNFLLFTREKIIDKSTYSTHMKQLFL